MHGKFANFLVNHATVPSFSSVPFKHVHEFEQVQDHASGKLGDRITGNDSSTAKRSATSVCHESSDDHYKRVRVSQ